MAAIKETFFQECEEQLAELEAGLLAMDEGDGRLRNGQRRVPRRPLDQGRRRRVQARRLVRFAHAFETGARPDPQRAARAGAVDVMQTMLRSADVLADLVTAARERRSGRRAARRRADRRAEGAVRWRRARRRAHGADGRRRGRRARLPAALLLSIDDLGDAGRRRPRATPINTSRRRPISIARATRRCACCANSSRIGRTAASTATRAHVPPLDALDPEGAYLAWRDRADDRRRRSGDSRGVRIRRRRLRARDRRRSRRRRRHARDAARRAAAGGERAAPPRAPRCCAAGRRGACGAGRGRRAGRRRRTGQGRKAEAAKPDAGGDRADHPRRSRARRSADQSRRRTGDQSGDAVAARAGGGRWRARRASPLASTSSSS